MKNFFKNVIITGTFMLGITSVASAHFIDISENSNYLNAIDYLMETNVINGYLDNTFKPDKKVTRAEFTKMISIVEELKNNENNIKVFGDTKNHWANSYIELMASNDLIKGYEDNTFKPEKEITYGEVATILLRTLGIYEVYTENINWPDDYMQMAEKMGLFNGIETNDLIGVNPARRDNVALMIYNKIQLETQIEEKEESGDVLEDTSKQNSEEIKEDNNYEMLNVDTKKIYFGVVKKIMERRGIMYVTLDDLNYTETDIKVNANVEVPKLDTLMFYKIDKKDRINLKTQLTFDDLNKDYLLVEEADKELIKLRNANELLDLDLDDFIYDNKKIELDEYTYYLLEMVENEDNEYEFDDVTEVKKEDLNIKKEDRIIFDSETELAYIIRGIENIEE